MPTACPGRTVRVRMRHTSSSGASGGTSAPIQLPPARTSERAVTSPSSVRTRTPSAVSSHAVVRTPGRRTAPPRRATDCRAPIARSASMTPAGGRRRRDSRRVRQSRDEVAARARVVDHDAVGSLELRLSAVRVEAPGAMQECRAGLPLERLPRGVGGIDERIPHGVGVGATDHPRASVRRAAPVTGGEPVERDDAASATGERGGDRGTVDAEAEHGDVDIGHERTPAPARSDATPSIRRARSSSSL